MNEYLLMSAGVSAETLQQVLHLNAELARLRDESALLNAGVKGIAKLLELTDVTLYAVNRHTGEWEVRTDLRGDATGRAVPPQVAPLLARVFAGAETAPSGDGWLATRLAVGYYLMGALVTRHTTLDPPDVLLSTFALNLAAHWRNLKLYQDARRRARELEILQGRHVDDIWREAGQRLHARPTERGVELSPYTDAEPPGGETFEVLAGDEAIGAVRMPGAESLPQSERDFVAALAREMGSALQNARLIQTTLAYSRQLKAAADVSQALSTLLEEPRLLSQVVELIRRRFDLDYVALYMREGEQAVRQAGTGESVDAPVSALRVVPLFDVSPVARAIREARAVVVRDETPALQAGAAPAGARATLPLRARGQVMGALDMYSTTPGAFSESEVTVLQSLAEQVAVALDNARLFAQVQDNYRRVNQLYEASRQMNTAPSAAAVYAALVDFAGASALADLALVLTPDPRSAATFLVHHPWSKPGLPEPAPEGRVPRAYLPGAVRLETNRPVLITDAPFDNLLDPRGREMFREWQAHSVACLPISADDQWLGCLIVARDRLSPYQEPELQPFFSLCAQAGVALANQLLLRETRALYHTSRSLNQALTAEDALEITLQQVVDYTGVPGCRFVRCHGASGAPDYFTAGADGFAADSEPLPFALTDTGLRAELAQIRKPLLVRRRNDEQYPGLATYVKHFNLESALFIPVLVQQQLYGFLALESPSGTLPFGSRAQDFASNAVAQLTTFLENIVLFDETVHRAQALIQLNQSGARLSGILAVEPLLDVLYEEIERLLPADIFLFATLDAEEQTFTPLRHMIAGQPALDTGRTRSLPADVQLPPGGAGLLGGAAALTLADQLQSYAARRPASALWVMLESEGQASACIGVHAFEPDAYDDTAGHLFRSVATQAGLALTNARLFQETQANVAEFRLLFSVSQAATASVEAGQRLGNMLRALRAGLRGADVAVYLRDAETERLQLAHVAGDGEWPGALDAAGHLSEQAARMAQPLRVHDLAELPDLRPELPGAKSLVSVPLVLGNHTVGVVTAAAPQANAFSNRDLRLLETLSVSLAATIESGRLFSSIQAANERLRALDQMKNRFLANMTHELRTPLNAIIGFSRVILKGMDGPLTPEQEQDLQTIFHNGQHLLALINDVLDLAKIEAGKLALSLEAVDLAEVATRAADTVRPLLEEKPVRLQLEIAPGLPPVEGDPVRLRQMLLNLLSNATKFTVEGEVLCRLELIAPEWVQITVADTGPGIAPEELDVLFRAFEQTGAVASTGQGTGLGLPITKSLVELHGGAIEVSSTPGAGATFVIRLPVRQNAAEGETV